MKNIFLLLISCPFMFFSSCSQHCSECVSVSYRLEPKIILNIDVKYIDGLIQAIETANAPIIVYGRVVRARPANEENLNGCSLSVKKGGRSHFYYLHNNFPFGISRGNRLIYNFRNILSEKDVRLLYGLIPAWKKG